MIATTTTTATNMPTPLFCFLPDVQFILRLIAFNVCVIQLRDWLAIAELARQEINHLTLLDSAVFERAFIVNDAVWYASTI